MRSVAVLLILGCALALSCGGPTRSHIKPEYVPHSPYGAWARVRSAETGLVDGELIAVEEDTIWVLHGSTMKCLPVDNIESLTVSKFDGSWGGNWLYVVGAVTTPFLHGFAFIFSAPIWGLGAIFGVLSTSGSEVFFNRFDRARKWARFPGGVPEMVRWHCISDASN